MGAKASNEMQCSGRANAAVGYPRRRVGRQYGQSPKQMLRHPPIRGLIWHVPQGKCSSNKKDFSDRDCVTMFGSVSSASLNSRCRRVAGIVFAVAAALSLGACAHNPGDIPALEWQVNSAGAAAPVTPASGVFL